MSDHFIVQDRLREIEFSGRELGRATTEKDDSLRWTEIVIYKTSGGKYIIERLGRSLIYHVPGESCDSSQGYPVTGRQLNDDSEPCPQCNPLAPEDSGFNGKTVFSHERTMSSAEVVDRPEDLHEALSMYDKRRKISRISHVASAALHMASGNDPELLNAIIRRVHVD